MSVTVAASLVVQAVLTVALCGVPAVAAMAAGGPGLLVIANPGLVTRAAAFAVTVYFPATVLALYICEVATPLALVMAVFPQAKLPLAPVVGELNVTSSPETGFFFVSGTAATERFVKVVLTTVLCGVPLV